MSGKTEKKSTELPPTIPQKVKSDGLSGEFSKKVLLQDSSSSFREGRGHRSIFRDCLARLGTVGNYAVHFEMS